MDSNDDSRKTQCNLYSKRSRERENETIGILMNDSTLFSEMSLPSDGSFPSIDF